MASTLINKELVEKYGLSQEIIFDSVCQAITKTLQRALRTHIITQEDDNGGVEIFALKKDIYAEIPVVRINPAKFKPKLLRALHYSIEKELESQKVQADFNKYMDLQNQLVKGYITSITKDGDLIVELEREQLFKRETLHAKCPLRYQPQHERNKYVIDRDYHFYVSKIYPGQVRGIPRLDIELNRKTARMPECLIMKAMIAVSHGLPSDENKFKCVKRISGACSIIESEKRIHRDIIKSVSRELHENIIVRYGKTKHA